MNVFEPGRMLALLKDIRTDRLPRLLRARKPQWSTLDVRYEPPHVERLWTTLDQEGVRLYLHRIHPCGPNEALCHPHPWPSAVEVVSGAYEMTVHYGDPLGDPFFPNSIPPEAARLVLTAGSTYEMVNTHGWHSVRPIEKPSLSIMIAGAPWSSTGRYSPGKGRNTSGLTDAVRDSIIEQFRKALGITMPRCAYCSGDGYVTSGHYDAFSSECRYCDGTGKPLRQRCRSCKREYRENCQECQGTRRIPYSQEELDAIYAG